MSQELLARLEAAVARLESLGVSGGAPKKAASSGDDDELDGATSEGLRSISDYEAFRDANVPKFLAAFDAYPFLAEHKAALAKGWDNQYALVKANATSKKPTTEQLLQFLQPSVDAVNFLSNVDRRSEHFNFLQVLADAAPFLVWSLNAPPPAYVESNRDAATLYINKILVGAKDLADDVKLPARAFCAAIKETLTAFAAYLKEYFKKGMDWNPNGKVFNAAGGVATATATAPAAAAKPAPVAAGGAAAAAAPAADKGNVFASLNQGLNVTGGLKKVTDDMKAKNQTHIPAVVPIKPKVAVKEAPKPSKPASIKQQGDSWFVEWQWDQPEVKIDIKSMTEAVYIGDCRNSNIYITGKPKSITIDKAFRASVFVDQFLSSVEIVNSDRATVYVTGEGGNTFAIDKSKGCVINLSQAAKDKNPDLITSNISECNVQIPGRTEEEYIMELAIPEQFIHKVVANTGKGLPWTVSAVPVSHG